MNSVTYYGFRQTPESNLEYVGEITTHEGVKLRFAAFPTLRSCKLWMVSLQKKMEKGKDSYVATR
jgi:hypothetical protein